MKNLMNDLFMDWFDNEDELRDAIMDAFSNLKCCKGNNEKCNTKSYEYYDKKTYEDNKLVDHIEKEYKDGKEILNRHEPNKCICNNEKKCIENKCCSKEQDKKIAELYEIIRSKDNMIGELTKENHNLKNKLNKIKNLF